MASLHPWEYFFNSLAQVWLHCNPPLLFASPRGCQAKELGSILEVGFARVENRPFKDFSAMPTVMVDLKKRFLAHGPERGAEDGRREKKEISARRGDS
jgi:hypothetical protein